MAVCVCVRCRCVGGGPWRRGGLVDVQGRLAYGGVVGRRDWVVDAQGQLRAGRPSRSTGPGGGRTRSTAHGETRSAIGTRWSTHKVNCTPERPSRSTRRSRQRHDKTETAQQPASRKTANGTPGSSSRQVCGPRRFIGRVGGSVVGGAGRCRVGLGRGACGGLRGVDGWGGAVRLRRARGAGASGGRCACGGRVRGLVTGGVGPTAAAPAAGSPATADVGGVGGVAVTCHPQRT